MVLLPLDIPYTPTLTTLNAIKARTDITSTNTVDDDGIVTIIREASTYIQRYCNRVFVPYVDTKLYFYNQLYTALELDTNDDLLTVTELLNTDDSEITSFVLTPLNLTPKQFIRLDGVSFGLPAGIADQIVVEGIWGYARRYPACWKASGVNVPAGNITDSATSVTLTSGQGATFAVLDYLKINDEVLQVTAITGDVLTVTRGELGTTPAAHTSGTAITIYQQSADISKAAIDLTLWFYRMINSNEQTVVLAGNATIRFDNAPSTIFATLDTYRRMSYYASGYING